MNDGNVNVVMRTILLLLMAANSEISVDRTADVMIHLWYSLLLKQADGNEVVEPVVQQLSKWSALDMIPSESGTSERRFERHGSSGGSSVVSVSLSEDHRQLMREPLLSDSLTVERAKELRETSFGHRKDMQDLLLSKQKPGHRVPFDRFRRDGMLLPFGISRGEYTKPNR